MLLMKQTLEQWGSLVPTVVLKLALPNLSACQTTESTRSVTDGLFLLLGLVNLVIGADNEEVILGSRTTSFNATRCLVCSLISLTLCNSH